MERPVARVPPRRTKRFGMVMVLPTATPSAWVAARVVVPTLARSGGGVRRAGPESRAASRGRKIPGTSPRVVCTSAGCASNSDGKKPPRVRRCREPSSRIESTVKPISSRCATNTTSGSPWPTRSHRLPAVSVSVLAHAGSSRFTASRTGDSMPETP